MKSKNIILITLAPKTHRTSEENLGLGYLKAVLAKNGYQVKIIDGWLNELSVDEVYNLIKKEETPLFIGISSYMSNTLPTIELIKKLKESQPDIKIVCGGFGPTFYPEDYLQHQTDFVIRGEGEETICELADSLHNDKDYQSIEGLSYINNQGLIIHNKSKKLIENLDIIPFPNRDTMPEVMKRKSTVNMLTARGCSGNCQFCSVVSFFRLSSGKVWRTRSIANIVDEIELLYNQGVKYIKMVDDSFVDGTRNEEWCQQFADEIEKRNIKVRLRGQIRADKVSDSILYNLKRAGFYSFACGIENGSATALKRMNKSATLSDNIKALEIFKKYEYLVQMGYILFDRDTSLEELEENYHFLQSYDFAVTKGVFSEMYSAEGTYLTKTLRKEGQLIESDFLNNNNKYVINNDQVRAVYEGLKKWHKSHSEIYDMTIDPLSSPKAIPAENIQEFYQYAMELKKQDLIIFKNILELVHQNKNYQILSEVDKYINDSNEFYKEKYEIVKTLYKKNNLIYNAEKNPFI